MTTIDKFINIATENEWFVERNANEVRFARPTYKPGDGYPAVVVAQFDPTSRDVTGGSVFNGYHSEEELEEYPVGSRGLLSTLAEVDNPFRFKTFHSAWLATHPASTAEKLLADRVNESERQIRNARITGSMTGYLADKLCVIVLGKHPIELYGFEAWVEFQSKGAWPEPSKRRKAVEPDEQPTREIEAAPKVAELPGGWR